MTIDEPLMDASSSIPAAVLRGRVARLQEWARQQNLHALVVFGQGSALGNATRSHGNLRFLMDWDADAAASAVIIPVNGSPSLVVANIFAAMRANENPMLAEVRFAKGPSFARAVIDLLPKGTPPQIAIAGREEIPVAIWEGLVAAGANNWASCEFELNRQRAIKDEIQIDYHRQAAAICDLIFERLGSALRSGLPVFKIQVELEQLGHQLGCEHCDTWLTVRPIADRCRYVASENTNVPKDGDQVLLGIMLMFHGHWGHAIRTGSLGEPSTAARKTFDIVSAMYEEMLARLRAKAALRLVGEAGIFRDPKIGPYFQFRSGHALGHSYEDPIGSPEFPQPYDTPPPLPEGLLLPEKGMMFEIHPNLFIEDFAGASIGDMVLVTENSAETLTKYPRGLLLF